MDELKETLGDNLVSLVVYGSVARGEAGKNSDVDTLVVASGLPESKLRRQEVFADI